MSFTDLCNDEFELYSGVKNPEPENPSDLDDCIEIVELEIPFFRRFKSLDDLEKEIEQDEEYYDRMYPMDEVWKEVERVGKNLKQPECDDDSDEDLGTSVANWFEIVHIHESMEFDKSHDPPLFPRPNLKESVDEWLTLVGEWKRIDDTV